MKKLYGLVLVALAGLALLPLACSNSSSSPTPSHGSNPTSTATPTDTNYGGWTSTPTATPTVTATKTATNTLTPTITLTPTKTNTGVFTNTLTDTATKTPTATNTPTATSTPTNTPYVYQNISSNIDGACVNGDTTGLLDHFNCNGYGTGASDIAYKFTLTTAKSLFINLCGATFDSVLYVCTDPANPSGTVVAMNDDSPYCGSFASSFVTGVLQPGTYYVVVDGYGSLEYGTFSLCLSTFTPTCSLSPNSAPITMLSAPSTTDLGSLYCAPSYPPADKVGVGHVDYFLEYTNSWTFTPSEAGAVSISLDCFDDGTDKANVAFDVYDSNGVSIATSYGTTPLDTLTLNLGKQQYTVVVYAFTECVADYHLVIQVVNGWVQQAYKNTFTTASGYEPLAMTFDNRGYLYVAEWNGGATGQVEIYDETQSPATFVNSFQVSGTNAPTLWGIAYNAYWDDIWVSDQSNNDVYAIGGLTDGLGMVWLDLGANGNSFSSPNNLANDAAGDVFVMDVGNYWVEEYPANETATQVTEWGYDYFWNAQSVATDPYDDVYVGDTNLNYSGEEGIIAWGPGDYVEADYWALFYPAAESYGGNVPTLYGIAADENYNIYGADYVNNAVDVWDQFGDQLGQFTGATFPTDVKINPVNGDLCFSDWQDGQIYVY